MPNKPAPALPAQPPDPLRAYRSKRDFGATPEPREGGSPDERHPAFVVQKHWARSLHYDLRLELDGTLKSWALPKGPSLDPAVRRMAVQVEDHPIAYAGFEGEIPARQYGAGQVIVWDTGHWACSGDAREGYRKGHLKFELHGRKLRGSWVLLRIKGRSAGAPPWLLIKEKDAFVRAAADFSVVDEQPDSVLQPQASADVTATKRAAAAPGSTRVPRPAARDPALPRGAVAAALPSALQPQLATLATGPPPDAMNWIHEIKFDGYRMLARIDHKGIRLHTRNGHDWSARLRPLVRSLARMELPPGWYDGEIVLPGAAGVPDFAALQRCFESATTDAIVYYLFDLPYVQGHDLRAVPLHERRALLQRLLGTRASDSVRISEVFVAPAGSLLASACRLGLEGVIAKRRDSPYTSSRSADWIKLKCGRRQEFVVGGYTDPQGTRTGFGALLLGVYDDQGTLQHAGRVGSGFSEAALQDLRRRLAPSVRATSPFAATARIEGRPHWVEPVWVAEVSFGDWTPSGRIRHAVFRGLRSDRDARSIVRERPQPLATDPVRTDRTRRTTRTTGTTGPGAATPASIEHLRVTHPDRVIDARTGTTKRALLHYFALVAPLMTKHLRGRPVSLLRAPDGVDGPQFFQKHAPAGRMPGLRQLDPALHAGHPPLIEVAGAQGLLSAAQWNVIEFHTMNGRAASFDHPDRLVFDLDPGDGVAWAQVQEAAQLTRSFLDTLGLPAFLKTSGGKGLHVVVPIRPGHDWDTAKGFARAVVRHIAKTIPQRFVSLSGPKNRVGRIYLDYLRNGRGATTVCAWSPRARPGLGISVPLAWDELDTLRGGDHWRVDSAAQRLAIGNRPWDGYARAARGLGAAMQALGYRTGP